MDLQVMQRAWQRERARRLAAEQLLSATASELLASFHDLERAHAELKSHQHVLVQTEKMASLGVLSAGVAHEINNPIGFVLSNLHTLKSNLPLLLEMLGAMRDVLQRIDATSPLASARDAVLRRLADSDADFVLADSAELIVETLSGVERVRAIVAGLKTFARSETDVTELIDLHEILDAAFTLLHNQIKHSCDIVRNFSALPRVLANPGKLAQVFVNLLVNAVQAIEEKASGAGSCGEAGKGAWGTITVTTWRDDGFVCVSVADSGCGIPDSVREHLFQPFFTTKPVGQGTGLGLAISYGIVHEHGGEIAIDSEFGAGARCTVKLPLQAH